MKTKRNVSIFIVITLASGWLGVLIDGLLPEQPEGNSLGMGLWLILPLLTAVILTLACRDGKEIGLRPNFKGNGKWYLLSLLIYPVVTAVTVGPALLFGCVDVSAFTIKEFLSLAAFSIAVNFIKNIFEEFAWRGFLASKLIESGLNDWLIYLITGLVWALWHAAYYLVFLPDRYFETISRGGMVLSGCILMLCWTVMYVEVYRLTKSVWPCVLMHAIEDGIPTVLVTTGGFLTFTG
ncbi:MAG: CPBP family intramembrane metalloprotease, partial [Lachnospiraceae bacterium]